MDAALDDYRWLVSGAAEPWLAIAREEPSGGASVRLLSRLRKELSAPRVHLVVEQAELRRRAQEKFSRAPRMFFTRKGLEQATDELVAAYKAARYPVGGQIVDLCCGIGGDLLALALRGQVSGIERDPAVAVLAWANAAVCGLAVDRCAVLACDALDVPLGGRTWHCDPDRRSAGRRTTRGELLEPSLESCARLLDHSPDAAIKLAPATELTADLARSAEREWISSRGECRQQVAWFGALAPHSSRRSATVLIAGRQPRTIVGVPDDAFAYSGDLGRYVYEPDAAVLAARLTAAICCEHGLATVSAGIAYLTGDRLIDDPALDAFELLDVLPLDRKRLKAHCRENRIGRLEIKKRGVEIDPERLRKEIIGKGEGQATILVAPVSGQTKAMVARRLTEGCAAPRGGNRPGTWD